MQSGIILIPGLLDVLENGLKNHDYILRDVSLFSISVLVNLPSIFIFYVFFRIFCDIVDNLTYKLLKQKYKKNWVQLQSKQIEFSLIKLYDRAINLRLRALRNHCLVEKEFADVPEGEH